MLKSAVWFLTMACNYECPYCWEVAYRKQGLMKPHCIPPAEKWSEAFNRIKPQVLDITGGEPFIMPGFVKFLESLNDGISVAITSNISIGIEELIASQAVNKIFSMTCSYHPTQIEKGVELHSFTKKCLRLKAAGVRALTVNYVAYPEQMFSIHDLKNHFESNGIRFHVDPYASIDGKNPYTVAQEAYLRPFVQSDRLPDAQPGDNVMCDGGMSHLSIQPDGTAYRCILDKQLTFEKYPNIQPVGNIFDPSFTLLQARSFCDQRYRCPGCDKDKVTIERI